MQHIMIEFGSELRERALTDGLMRAIGIGHYVITVLVPELAVDVRTVVFEGTPHSWS